MFSLPRGDQLSHVPIPEQKVVLFHQGALGDFLLCLSVLDGLARAHPAVRYLFRTRNEYLPLISRNAWFGGFMPAGGADLIPFFQESSAGTAPLPADFSRAESALILGQSSSQSFAESLARKMSGPVRWIQSFPSSDQGVHVSRFVRDQLHAVGWKTRDTVFHLEAAPEAIFRVKTLMAERGVSGSEPFWVAHVGSGGRRKIWPLPRWKKLFQDMSLHRPEKLVTVLGPADEPLCGIVTSLARDIGACVLDGLDLGELAALLACAAAYVGNDSGVTHLAAAMGTPTLALFGPTRPEIWAPLGVHVRVHRSLWSEREILAGQPSHADLVDVEHVQGSLEALLNGRRPPAVSPES